MMSMAFASVSSGRGKALVSNRSAMSRVSSGVFFQAQPGQGDKQMSQGHQAHVMMPTRPRPRFVLRHAQITLAFLEKLFHAVACPRHQGHRLQRLVGGGVGQVVLHLGRRLQRASQQQPTGRPWGAMTHGPHPHPRERIRQRPLGPGTQLQHLPGRWRQAGREVTDTMHLGPLRPCRGPTPGRGHLRLRIHGPHRPIGRAPRPGSAAATAPRR